MEAWPSNVQTSPAQQLLRRPSLQLPSSQKPWNTLPPTSQRLAETSLPRGAKPCFYTITSLPSTRLYHSPATAPFPLASQPCISKKQRTGAGDMAQRLGALAALAEGQGWTRSTHTATHNSCHSSSRGSNTLSGFSRHQT